MNLDYYTSFEDFQRDHAKRINATMSTVLWFCALTGPAIALGIFTGIFPEAKYSTCVNISVFMILLSMIHSHIYKAYPEAKLTSFFALFAMDFLLVYMSYSHIYIHITWFLIPFLSILLCDLSLYCLTVFCNFVMISLSTWITASYFAEKRMDYNTPLKYFLNEMGGRTIETIIMAFAGYYILKIVIDYFITLLSNYETIVNNKLKLQEQLNLLDSMAEIYDKVNLIDFNKMTEFSLRNQEKIERPLDFKLADHTWMTTNLSKCIAPDQTEAFLNFTNITNVQQRLDQKKLISAEFIDIYNGWFRAQYITVERDANAIPSKIIFTIQNIDAEKQREEHLIRIAMTDELTRLYNRRCYDDDINELSQSPLPENIGLMSFDVNGLKQANDTKGHAAGDELITAAADCIVTVIGTMGKVYRTGGDEFIAIVYTDDFEIIKNRITMIATSWTGVYLDKLAISIGYARLADNPNSSLSDLEKISDMKMYEDKSAYYRKNGIERRRL